MTRQYVAAYPDGRYTVRTYRDGRLIREVPANMRDIAQATLKGDVVEVDQ